MQSESICANDIEGLDTDTLIPVELFDNIPQHPRSQDNTLSIVELGKQLLHSAKNGDLESVRELMCRGAPFTTDWLGTSALHFAAQSNHLEVAEVLLRAGISRDARTKVDKTPLHMAAYEGHHEMVQLLLNYGADVDSRDMLKMTPLHWAVERKHVDVMHILLDHGADRTAASKFNKTPVSLALECDRLDLVDILQQERDVVVGIQQQPQNNTAELEVATHNLVHLEPESNSRNLEEEEEEEEQKFEVTQQHMLQHKHKVSPVSGESERKKQKLMFQQIPVSPNNVEREHEKEFEDIEISAVNNITNSKKYKDITAIGNFSKHFRLLEGITMIPVEEESSIVENAMESGRTVVLTEAGRLALNSTKGSPIKRFQVAARKAPRKVIAIRADQIPPKILNPNSNAATIATRGPNILKRAAVDKPGKLFVTTVANTTISAINKIKNSVSPKEKLASSPMKAVLQLDDDIEEITEVDEKPITDIAVLTRQLAEAQRQADEYRNKMLEKEREAEIYKQQLKNMSAQIASK